MKRDDILKILIRFKEGNQQKYRIKKIGIFGSSARGDMNTESDIDVVEVCIVAEISGQNKLQQYLMPV